MGRSGFDQAAFFVTGHSLFAFYLNVMLNLFQHPWGILSTAVASGGQRDSSLCNPDIVGLCG